MLTSPSHIVITGVSRGIGRALTAAFIALGHRVSGCARGPCNAAQLGMDGDADIACESLDVVDAAAVEAWASKCITRWGSPDLLINNAAVINRSARFVDLPAAEFDPLIDINIKGVANVMRAFLPAMEHSGKGVLINLSSGWGRSTSPEVAPYCASKWAIEGLTRAVAQELPAGLAAIPLSPNTVNTAMLQQCFGVEGASHAPDPETWARTVAPWLLTLGPDDNGKPLSTPV